MNYLVHFQGRCVGWCRFTNVDMPFATGSHIIVFKYWRGVFEVYVETSKEKSRKRVASPDRFPHPRKRRNLRF